MQLDLRPVGRGRHVDENLTPPRKTLIKILTPRIPTCKSVNFVLTYFSTESHFLCSQWASGELDEADMFNQDEKLTPSKRFRESPRESGRSTPAGKDTPQKASKDLPPIPRPEKSFLSRQDSAQEAPDAPEPAAHQLSELLQAKSQAVRGDVAYKLNKLPTVVIHQVWRMTGFRLAQCLFRLNVIRL
jgi:hypothetical protein